MVEIIVKQTPIYRIADKLYYSGNETVKVDKIFII